MILLDGGISAVFNGSDQILSVYHGQDLVWRRAVEPSADDSDWDFSYDEAMMQAVRENAARRYEGTLTFDDVEYSSETNISPEDFAVLSAALNQEVDLDLRFDEFDIDKLFAEISELT